MGNRERWQKSREIRNVEFGEESINQYILVLKGLNAGDQIILNPPNELAGDLVKSPKKMKSYIEALNLTKEYRKGEQVIKPLENLSLSVEQGILLLMGPSGSGKTTLLNLIAGVDTPSFGTLRGKGSTQPEQMTREQLTRWRSKYLGYIFQLYHLMPVLTAYENVELPLLIHSMSKKERRER